jgi:hypothetical protein
MTSSRFRRIFLLGLLTAQLFAAAKPKAASPPTPDPATTVPPQVYGLDDVPSTIIQALPNLLKKGDMEPRLIWYKTEKAKTSATAAVILVPMACKDEPDDWKSVERRFWNGRKNYDSKYGMDKGTLDPDFAMACGKTPMGDKVKFLTPSLPSQNKNPLKAGDGIIAAIYDRDSLIKSANPDYIGFSVQSVNANPLNPAPLRQTQPAANPEIPSKETPPTRHFYYLVWNGNPVVGDTTLTISVTLINPVASSPDRVQLGNGDTGRPNPVGVPDLPVDRGRRRQLVLRYRRTPVLLRRRRRSIRRTLLRRALIRWPRRRSRPHSRRRRRHSRRPLLHSRLPSRPLPR